MTSGVTKVHASEQGRPRIPSFSNRGGVSHCDYSAQRGTLYRQTSDARSGGDVFDSMHDMNLRKSVGGSAASVVAGGGLHVTNHKFVVVKSTGSHPLLQSINYNTTFIIHSSPGIESLSLYCLCIMSDHIVRSKHYFRH